MKTFYPALALTFLLHTAIQGAPAGYADRFVWLFGWGLNSDKDVEDMSNVVVKAGKAGLNGAVATLGMDTLCRQSPDYFRRLAALRDACNTNRLEFIPAVFSIGYGGGALAHDRNLAEGLPVRHAVFKVFGNTATLMASGNLLTNGGFEQSANGRATGYQLQDEPGKVTQLDSETRRSGKVSLRFENFGEHPAGNGRVMQNVKVTPHRAYRVALWVKTEGLNPGFRSTVLADGRALAPREFHIPPTSDWRRISYVFNSLEHTNVSIYSGVWGGRSGKLWLDDMSVEEIGLVNVLKRPGTPFEVKSADGRTVFAEGRDYAHPQTSAPQPFRDDHEALPLRILPGSRIKDGDEIKVSWFHSMLIHDSQVTVCMAEPALDEIFDHEARLLAENVAPAKVLLNMDEVRMGGTCNACRGRDMAQLLGECVQRQVSALRKYSPKTKIYIWSDMFDPHHNSQPNYYLVKGDYTGSWNYVPKDLVIAVWGGEPRPESAKFFSDLGFETLFACYYDANDLGDVRGWIDLSRKHKGVRGLMYTPWLRKYDLLSDFGALLRP